VGVGTGAGCSWRRWKSGTASPCGASSADGWRQELGT